MESKTFKVPNIGCDGCVSTIKNELGQLAGVTRVDADRDTKVVTVQWQPPASWQEIESHLTEIDYAPELA
jgi:copper chaperone CopZ